MILFGFSTIGGPEAMKLASRQHLIRKFDLFLLDDQLCNIAGRIYFLSCYRIGVDLQ